MKISIITVVKNDERFIEKTVKSIINQHLPIEYIVVDGNSTDATFEIIKKYQNKIDLIISEKDDGLYDAMNKGIKNATGDIIGTCNSGDVILENKLQIVLKEFETKKVDFVFATVKRHYTGGTIIKSGFNKKKINYNFDFATCHSTGFYIKNSVQKEIGTYDTSFKCSADYDLFYRLINVKKYIGGSTPKDIIVGEVAKGGLSSKISFFNHLKEESKIRYKNKQSFILIILIFLNAIFKKLFIK
jgi:glycosyltransferase involved in cell wall biosynthesis